MAKGKSVFADLQGLPTSMGAGEIYKQMKPVSKGVDLPASQSDREIKKKYDDEPISVDTDGFTIYASMQGAEFTEKKLYNEVRTPKTYFKFTVGQASTYSFYFGPDAPSYPFLDESILVTNITINQKDNSATINFTNADAKITIKNGKWSMPKFANEAGTNGLVAQKSVDSAVGKFPAMLISVAPYNAANVLFYKNAVADKSKMATAMKELMDTGNGLYHWSSAQAEVYLSPQSFTFDSGLDKEILLPPSFDFDTADTLDTTKSYIRFNCVIENASLRTNNYTGYDKQDPSILMTTLQFPGDEALLAPMGTSDEGTEVACGLEAPEGRVLKSIKPVVTGAMVQQVKLEFHDGSFCVFPDAETGLFTATDKETGQELQGRVENLIIAEGKWREGHAEEVANRIERNINSSLTVMSDGKSMTSAIAWRTNNPSQLKVIVPTDEGTKLITIPLKEA
tara:strand:- start:8987 stop:10345 length:1359 start_codon:yes stop_codon:yes gene_type:complete